MRVIKNGKVAGLRGVLIDITERINYEKRLKQNSERLELALMSSDSGLWDWNMTTDEIFFDKEWWYEKLGYEAEEYLPGISFWKSIIHPEDREMVTENFRKILNNESQFYRAEYRILSKSGEWKWILDTGKITEYDSENIPIRAVGTLHDITGKKENELAILQNLHHQEIVSQIALKFNSVDDFTVKINDVMHIIGNHLNLSRIFIYEDDETEDSSIIRHIWHNQRNENKNKYHRKIHYSGFQNWKEKLFKRRIFFNKQIRFNP
ncbi:MAG: PAS domain-containing protein [Bacteroidales bacterium]|nr:PAS domain-containing protein [Bacteroidales bacterium]